MSYPTGAAPAAPAVKKSKSGVIFGVLFALSFLGAAGASGMYLVTQQKDNKTISDQKATISKLQDDLKAKDGKLTEAQNKVTEVTGRADKAEACQKAVQDFLGNFKAGTTPTTEQTVNAFGKCGVPLI